MSEHERKVPTKPRPVNDLLRTKYILWLEGYISSAKGFESEPAGMSKDEMAGLVWLLSEAKRAPEELAAKDAEIAELRARVSELEIDEVSERVGFPDRLPAMLAAQTEARK